jgi:hypothetical protein
MMSSYNHFEMLEPRMLLSASPIATDPDAVAVTGSLQQEKKRRQRLKRAASRFVAVGGSVVEGDPGQTRKLTFTVKRQGSITGVATVRFRAVAPGNFSVNPPSATAGVDFVPRTGQLTFAPGVKQLKVQVNVIGDNNPEFDETVRLELFQARGAALKTASAIGLIRDNDAGKLMDVGLSNSTFNPDPGKTYPPDPLPVSLTFSNSGNVASGPTRVQFFMGNFDNADNLRSYVDLGAPIAVPSIAAGGNITRNYVIDFNQSFIFNDSWAVFARVLIEDTNMLNNSRFLGFVQINSTNS